MKQTEYTETKSAHEAHNGGCAHEHAHEAHDGCCAHEHAHEAHDGGCAHEHAHEAHDGGCAHEHAHEAHDGGCTHEHAHEAHDGCCTHEHAHEAHDGCCTHEHAHEAHDGGCTHEHAHEAHDCGCAHEHAHEAHDGGHMHTPAFGAHIHCTCESCSHEHADEDGAPHSHHEHGEDEEGGNALKKILLAAALFALALIVEHTPFFAEGGYLSRMYALTPQTIRLGYMVLYLAAYLMCGRQVVLSAARNITRGKIFDEQFLMTIASLGAVCLGEYAEAVAVMLFYQVGEFFQDYAVDTSRASISALMDIRPDTAFVFRNGAYEQVAPEEVQVGDIVQVKNGERIALDGIVDSGESFVDTSALTGESVPRKVSAGDEVLAGFVNTQGVITVRVTKPCSESAVTRILEFTEKATAVKAQSERFITRFARVYTPIVCILAACVAVIPPLCLQIFAPELFARYGWQVWAERALMFLVVSCPCALVISVPLSFFSGIGATSSRGVLVKGSNYMEALARVRTAVFDKTGTLTKGIFSVTHIEPHKTALISADELIAIAAHAESCATHPISRSLKAAHSCPHCAEVVCKDMQELSGKGLSVTVDGKHVLAGNAALMTAHAVKDFEPAYDDKSSGTVVHVAVDGSYAGYIVISDEAKDDAKGALESLKKLGVRRTVMLTGDNAAVSQKVGELLGVDAVHAELLPEGKVQQLEALLAEKSGTVLFAGDGVNDSPVLARADVGVAMGALGSDAAIEAADVVIMDDRLSRLADAIKIARSTVSVVWQNIVFALGVKAAIMALGAAGIANLWVAVFGDVGVAFLCVLNALRLLRLSKKAAL